MEWSELYDMQRELDKYIQDSNGLAGQELFPQKLLALLVELGELANETRCFKFWSTKPPSEKQVMLEEYVDVLHFMLSLGLGTGYRFNQEKVTDEDSGKDTTKLFLDLFQICTSFGNAPGEEKYDRMFATYLTLGKRLDFQKKDIEEMYLQKNGKNYQRQDEGY